MGLPLIVANIGTMNLFRGIAYIILGDKAFNGYPPRFAYFRQGYVGWVLSFEPMFFTILPVIYVIVLHRTVLAACSMQTATTSLWRPFPASGWTASRCGFSC